MNKYFLSFVFVSFSLNMVGMYRATLRRLQLPPCIDRAVYPQKYQPQYYLPQHEHVKALPHGEEHSSEMPF